jgi:hypothetical protein
MKLPLGLFSCVFVLSGCANLFDMNAFEAIDQPPKLVLADLPATATLLSLKLTSDPGFIDSLAQDATALAAVQTTLQAGMASTDTAVQLQAAKDFIYVTTNATSTLSVVNNAVGPLLSLASGGASSLASGSNQGTAVQSLVSGFFTGLSPEALLSTLDSMATIGNSFSVLSTASAGSTTSFFSGSDSGTTAQVGVVSATMSALMASTGEDLATANGRKAAATAVAALLASPDPNTFLTGGSFPTVGTQMGYLSDAVSGTSTTQGTNPYSYVKTLMGVLPI